MAKFPVSEYAAKFGCHVKTILRAVLREAHPSDWDPEPLDLKEVAKAFKMVPAVLERVMSGEDELLDAKAAAELIGISVRRLHQMQEKDKKPRKVASHGRTVRYLHSDLIELAV